MSEAVIEITGLFRRFGRNQALDDVSLSIPRGCVFGLVGENGAGKTTLLRHVLGLLRARQGTVRVFGRDPVALPAEVLSRVGYLAEDRDLPDWMSVAQLMRYTEGLYRNWDPRFADELCQRFELDREQQIKKLSRGQRARAGLLVALAHRPELLILDEPSSGLDPIVRRDILTAIIRTVADEGRTVLFSSHLLDEVERVADTVAMIHQGSLGLCAPLPQILQDHRRLVLRFEEPQAALADLPGMLAAEGEGAEWTVLANGGLEELRAAAADRGAQIVEEATASLEEIFVARCGAHRAVNASAE